MIEKIQHAPHKTFFITYESGATTHCTDASPIYADIEQWLADGNTIEAEFTAEEIAANNLAAIHAKHAALWQACDDYQHQFITGTAAAKIAYVRMNEPENIIAIALSLWLDGLWAEYEQRKLLLLADEAYRIDLSDYARRLDKDQKAFGGVRWINRRLTSNYNTYGYGYLPQGYNT